MGRRRQIIGRSRLDSVDSLMGSGWVRRQLELAVEEASEDSADVRDNTRTIAARNRLLRTSATMILLAGVTAACVAVAVCSFAT